MNILLVRTGGLGDCILTLPVAACLRQLNPDSNLRVLGNATMLAVARLSGMFDGFFHVDTADYSGIFSENEPSPFLRSFFSDYDEVFFFTAGDSKRLKKRVLSAGAGRCFIRDPNPPKAWRDHITVHLAGIIRRNRNHRKTVCDSIPSGQKNSVSQRKGLVIHPGSGGMTKNWPIERFISVAETWRDETTFVLGPAEIERGFERMMGERFGIVKPETIESLCRVLSGASLYLGNDSGVSHCAVFCGTASVVLFGPTDPAIWKPPGHGVSVVSSRDKTMEGLGVPEVLGALDEAQRL
ncbi:glycosyltransferase family 9 protein [bacterium]|nr:glycosyltransferase family 9 protein [bacterium]